MPAAWWSGSTFRLLSVQSGASCTVTTNDFHLRKTAGMIAESPDGASAHKAAFHPAATRAQRALTRLLRWLPTAATVRRCCRQREQVALAPPYLRCQVRKNIRAGFSFFQVHVYYAVSGKLAGFVKHMSCLIGLYSLLHDSHAQYLRAGTYARVAIHAAALGPRLGTTETLLHH